MVGTVLTEIISCGHCCCNWMCSSHPVETFGFEAEVCLFSLNVFPCCCCLCWSLIRYWLIFLGYMTEMCTNKSRIEHYFFNFLCFVWIFRNSWSDFDQISTADTICFNYCNSSGWQAKITSQNKVIYWQNTYSVWCSCGFFPFRLSPSLLCSLVVIDRYVRYDGASWR